MHKDKSWRVAAIHRCWRNDHLTDDQMVDHMERIGAGNTASIWLRGPKPGPRTVTFEVTFFGRKYGSQGVFFKQAAEVESTRTPSPYDAIIALGGEGFEINHITLIRIKTDV